MWSSVVDGRPLTFRLAGINNQNFVMRDEQTGSWWQQVTGLAIHGPLAGKRLTLVPHDQLTFETWKAEQPSGRVLKWDEDVAAREDYAEADWDEGMARAPVPALNTPKKEGIEGRTLMVGITIDGRSKAWPHQSVLAAGATLDELNGVPLLLLTAPDGRSVRAFDRRVGGETLTFVRAGTSPYTGVLLDLETLSEWTFQGRAVKGQLEGSRLSRVDLLIDYWFDWVNYHPDTEVVKPWTPRVRPRKTPIPRPK